MRGCAATTKQKLTALDGKNRLWGARGWPDLRRKDCDGRRAKTERRDGSFNSTRARQVRPRSAK